MKKPKMESERRIKPRRLPKAVTFVALRPEFAKLGKLVDISGSGLCFEYIKRGDDAEPCDSLSLDMFISGNGFYLPQVPCRLVYDVRTEKEMTFMTSLEYRRCGLQFAGLSGSQIDQLEYFLAHHTTGADGR